MNGEQTDASQNQPALQDRLEQRRALFEADMRHAGWPSAKFALSRTPGFGHEYAKPETRGAFQGWIAATNQSAPGTGVTADLKEVIKTLNPATADLVRRFSVALAGKLAQAERKYGYSDEWRRRDWLPECRAHLRAHLAKGDPRDVAGYCAFLWDHGEPTYVPGEQEASETTYESRVDTWIRACLGSGEATNGPERAHRFLEEAIELVQACGCTASAAHELVDYVFGRPVGDPAREVGGVMLTLAALCNVRGIPMLPAGELELDRVWMIMNKIRAKHASRQPNSPLPGVDVENP